MEHAVKTGMGVSSRIFRKAVDRNRVKRLLREAYRTEKLPLHEYLDASGKRVLLFILYTDRSFPEYSLLKTKMHIALHRLVNELHEASPANT
jgi:ribonuclease P protein component